MPFILVKDFYRYIINFHKNDGNRTESYALVNPEINAEKNKEFKAYYETSVFKPHFFWNKYGEIADTHIKFLHCLDFFLDMFHSNAKKLGVSDKKTLQISVYGLPYSLNTNREQFLKDCLRKRIERPTAGDPYDIHAKCSCLIPSSYGYISSQSFSMKLISYSNTSTMYSYFHPSYHWTTKSAEEHVRNYVNELGERDVLLKIWIN